MGLISITNIPLTADEDIVCYKTVLHPCIFTYRTPITKTFIPIWCILGLANFKAKGVEQIGQHQYDYATRFDIGEGFIHTDKSMVSTNSHNYCIFECIIPKGTKYFISADSSEYCSKQIKFVKRIK